MSNTNIAMTIDKSRFQPSENKSSFDLWIFAKAIQFRKDFQVMAFSAIAHITAGLFFEELLYDKMLANSGSYTEFYLANLDAALSWSENELKNRVYRCFAKGMREMTELNAKVRRTTGTPFMRKVLKIDGLWDMNDVRAFIDDFESTFNEHYNPDCRPNCYLRDIPWMLKAGINDIADA